MLRKTVTGSIVFYQKQKRCLCFSERITGDLTAMILFDNAIVEVPGWISVRVNVACMFGSSKQGKAEEQLKYHSYEIVEVCCFYLVERELDGN